MTTFWFHETHHEARKTREAGPSRSPFNFGAMRQALNRKTIGFLLLVMFFYQVAFGGYEQLFSLFTLTRLGMDATDTAGLFALAGIFIVVIQGVLIGRWSRQKGDRWLVILGVSALSIGLIGTSLTPQLPVPWYNRGKVLESLAGQGPVQVSVQSIKVTLPEQA